MSDAENIELEDQSKKKGSLKPIVFGFVAAIVLGGASAFTVSSGLVQIPGLTSSQSTGAETDKKEKEEKPAPEFVDVDPVAIPVLLDGLPRQLRLSLSLEVEKESAEAIDGMSRRISDVVNTMLRTIDEQDLADPTALDRLRAQLLRRIRLVADGAAVNDVLIVEYIIL